MAKTYRRRRHRRANRTRRGGVKHSAASAPLASAASPRDPLAPALDRPTIDMDAIKRRVLEIAAQGATHASASKKSKGISKQQASKKRFSGILSGKVKHSHTSAFKGQVESDPFAAYKRGY